MRITCELFSQPFELKPDKINVVCIENINAFRTALQSFFNNNNDEFFVFSENFKPFDFKDKCIFIFDYFNLEYSSVFIKKIYQSVELLCHNELSIEFSEFCVSVEKLMSRIVEEFDYDLEYDSVVNLSDILKAYKLHPKNEDISIAERLIDFILFHQKFAPKKCYVLTELHSYFTSQEIEQIYNTLSYNNVVLFDIEHNINFERCKFENYLIIDKDLCEIVEF